MASAIPAKQTTRGDPDSQPIGISALSSWLTTPQSWARMPAYKCGRLSLGSGHYSSNLSASAWRLPGSGTSCASFFCREVHHTGVFVWATIDGSDWSPRYHAHVGAIASACVSSRRVGPVSTGSHTKRNAIIPQATPHLGAVVLLLRLATAETRIRNMVIFCEDAVVRVFQLMFRASLGDSKQVELWVVPENSTKLVDSTEIKGAVTKDRYTCRTPRFHMRSHCTAQTTRAPWLKLAGLKVELRPKIGFHPHVMLHLAPHSTLNTSTTCEQNTLARHIFSCFTHTHCNVARDIGSRCLAHVIHVSSACCCCLDTLRPSTLHSSPSLSSSFSFSCSSSPSSMWVGSMRSPMRTSANEDLGTLAENSPLTGYEPNFIDNYHISETTEIFIRESSSDSRPSNLHDMEIDDYTIGRALSSPLFTHKREDPASRRQVYHSPDESLLSSQSSSVRHVGIGRLVFDEFGSLISYVREKSTSRLRKWANPDSSGTTKRA